MLIEWLKLISPAPSLEVLVKALMQPSVNCCALAIILAEKYGVLLPGIDNSPIGVLCSED
jgi:hypothetical protein